MKYIIILISILLLACNTAEKTPQTPYVMVLGVAQDAGYPQMNCKKECCKAAWEKKNKNEILRKRFSTTWSERNN